MKTIHLDYRQLILLALIAHFPISAAAFADDTAYIVTPFSATTGAPVEIDVYSPYCSGPPGDTPYTHIRTMSSSVSGQVITIAIGIAGFACFSAAQKLDGTAEPDTVTRDASILYVPFTFPQLAAGTYYVQYSYAFLDGGMSFDYSATFNVTSAPPPYIAPVEGMWWDPAESGTGYAIDVKHGVLVMTIFSFTDTGQPQWYLVTGNIINNAVTGPLLKFSNGQCISCAYQPPTAAGDDGTAKVQFISPKGAYVQLPGGHYAWIIPQDF